MDVVTQRAPTTVLPRAADVKFAVTITGRDIGSARIVEVDGDLELICDEQPYHAPAGRMFKLFVENQTTGTLAVALVNFRLYAYPVHELTDRKTPGDWDTPPNGGPESIPSGDGFVFKLKTNNSSPGEWYKFDLVVTRGTDTTVFDPELQIDNPPN